MRVTGPWLTAPGLRRVLGLLSGAGHQALVVGGAVRNDLLGVPISDVDIATDARPDRVTALLAGAGLRTIPTGLEHGTITALSDGQAFEITTFRRDVETDGRRAVVAFADRVEDDAQRRDFTINALYATAEGEVLDPTGGLADLPARRLRFVGDPVAIGNTTAVAGSLPADRASFDTVSPPCYRSTIGHDGAGPLRSAA